MGVITVSPFFELYIAGIMEAVGMTFIMTATMVSELSIDYRPFAYLLSFSNSRSNCSS